MLDRSAARAARERTIAAWLVRLIQGECATAEVRSLAREAGFPTFADLCAAALPERLPRVRLDRAVVARGVDRAVAGELPLSELRAWSDELHAIAFRHALGTDRSERRHANEALALLSVAADDAIFGTRAPVEAVLTSVAASLRDRQPIEAPELYGRLFSGQERLHLATRQPLVGARARSEDEEQLDAGSSDGTTPPGESLDAPFAGEPEDEDASWADVVARSAPGRATAADPSAVVAFAAVTEAAVRTDGPGTSSPVTGLIARVRACAPNFALGRYRPRVQRDVDGILEFVLASREIDRPAILYATKLFALLHGIGEVTLDGERVSTIR